MKKYSFYEIREALIALTVGPGLPMDMCEITEAMLFPPASTKCIGYQVVTTAGYPDIHPEMQASYSILGLDQAEEMLLDSEPGKYKIVPVIEGEIEDPEFTYEDGGNPDESIFNLGQRVICDGKEDILENFIPPLDVENYSAGYRYQLKNAGTQSPGSITPVDRNECNLG